MPPATVTFKGDLPPGSSLLLSPTIHRVSDEDAESVVLPDVSIGVGTSGQFSVTPYVTDDSNYMPVNWVYHVTGSTPYDERIDFYMGLPAGPPIDLAAVMPVPATQGMLDTRYAMLDTVDDLRARTTALFGVQTLGCLSVGDGGGGLWYWDADDTTSDDNTGTVVIPDDSLMALEGRWKRVLTGNDLSVRAFGVVPSVAGVAKADCTQELQNAVTWAATVNVGAVVGYELAVPPGYYRFQFEEGDTDIETILQDQPIGVRIRGAGEASIFTVRRTAGNPVEYFFTWAAATRGFGGGIENIRFDGNSDLEWCLYLDTWHDFVYRDITATDIFGGMIDACASVSALLLGEGLKISGLDYYSSSGVNSCFMQYGIRLRTAVGGGTWTDSWISECMFANCWDTGVLLDGCNRISVMDVAVACNSSSTNTIDGAAHAGVRRAVEVTNTVANDWTIDTGYHVIDDIYMESHEGSETNLANVAVVINSTHGDLHQVRNVKVSNVTISTNILGLFRVMNSGGFAGNVTNNEFRGNRREYLLNSITIDANVFDTFLFLTHNGGQLARINDSGTRTYVNGVLNYAWGSSYPVSTSPTAAPVDVGDITRDTATGRMAIQDRNNTPVIVSGDVGRHYGSHSFEALATPAAPVVTKSGTGATSWDYYVVAIDRDGNKTPPSPVGSVATAPNLAGLAAAPNQIRWQPVEGAVAYDLLRGATNTSIQLGVVTCHYFDAGIATSAYVASAVSPPGAARFTEQASDPAGIANSGILYTRDTGGGKTELVVRFGTGAIQVIATEP